MKYLKRLFRMPFGLLKGLLTLANEKARDSENKYRFANSIIDEGSSFSIGTKIGFSSHILSGATINNSSIGDYSYCNKNTLIQNASIGNFCSISNDVIIGPGSHPIDQFSTSPLFYKVKNTFDIRLLGQDLEFEEYKPIIIGSDVWIGARAIIMNGISIGHGAIIASGAVVTRDVQPYSIVGGVPARTIKMRFQESVIEELLLTKWWENDPRSILTNRKYFERIINAH